MKNIYLFDRRLRFAVYHFIEEVDVRSGANKKASSVVGNVIISYYSRFSC